MKDQDDNAKDSTWTPCNFSFIYSLMHLFNTNLLFIYNMLDTVLGIIDIKMNKKNVLCPKRIKSIRGTQID